GGRLSPSSQGTPRAGRPFRSPRPYSKCQNKVRECCSGQVGRVTKFDEATRAIRVDDQTYDVCLDNGFSIGGPLNGGYLMAAMLRAVVDESPHEHPVSTSAQFLRVARPGAARVRVERIKTGRTAAVSRATLIQEGQAVVEALV